MLTGLECRGLISSTLASLPDRPCLFPNFMVKVPSTF